MQAVAPFVGAWIEISLIDEINGKDTVAPFVGAWIDIYDEMIRQPSGTVAPFVGAWIEMAIAVDLIRELMSLRSSERGLKYMKQSQGGTNTWSLRSSERGLK